MIILKVILLLGATMVKMIKKYTSEEFKAYGKAGSISQEALSSIRTVLSFGIHKRLIKMYAEKLKLAENMAIKKGLLTGIFGGIQILLHNSGLGFGLFWAVYLIRTECDNYSVKTVMPSFFLIITATFSLAESLSFIGDIAAARSVAKKIFAIIDKKSEIDVFDDKNQGKILEKLEGSIEFDNVFFNYPSRPEARILKGLNLRIPAGKTVALVGPR
jgi:ABC-type multidrug transport system fused ATPase/permease subunit